MNNEITAQCAQEAMDFISDNMKYFRVVTVSGKEVKVKNLKDRRIRDDYYNPKEVNDDKILTTCQYAEIVDLKYRAKDTAHRLWRNTVLVTNDRCLRIKTTTSIDLPVREIRSFSFWVANSANYMRTRRRPFDKVGNKNVSATKSGVKKKRYPLGHWNYISKAVL